MTPPSVRLIVPHPTDRQIIFLQTADSIRLPGDLYRSRDGGSTWEVISIANGIGRFVTALAFDRANPDVLYAGTEEGQGFFVSTDGGSSWLEIQNEISTNHLAALAIDASTKTVYAAVDLAPATELGVWKSMDGGRSFVRSSAGLAGSGVNDITLDRKDLTSSMRRHKTLVCL